MALELDVTCSNHQHWKEPRRIRVMLDGPDDLDPKVLKARIEQHGWIVQLNGEHMDTYCSKKCAE